MAVSFSQTLRYLGSDGHGRPIVVLALGAPALALWCLWFFFARLPDYETSTEARVERDAAVFRISAPADGTVAARRLAVGRRVQRGELLVELDSQRERARLEEESARVEVLLARLESETREIASQEGLLAISRRTSELDVRQAVVRLAAAVQASGFSATREARWRRLKTARLISRDDFDQRASEAAVRRAEAGASRVAVAKLRSDWELKVREQQATLERMIGTRQATGREIEATRAAIARLQYELQQRTVRSPIDGTIAEAATLQTGSLVRRGDDLGVIVPGGQLRISAYLSPAGALGRIRPGQSAKMQLLGFPAAQFGYLGARVASVASELRDGKIRVELQPTAERLSGIAVEHGMPGTVQIEVETLSPARFVLRSAGKRLSEHPERG